MKKLFMAVLKITVKEISKVYVLAGRVIKQYTDNSLVFTDPDPSIASLTTENNKLDLAIKAKDGSHQKNRACEEQAQVVFNMLKNGAAYVTKVAQGDKAIILLGGYEASKEPEPKQIPEKVVIKRIADGNEPCTAKIFIEKLNEADRYKVESTTTPDDKNSWKVVLDPGSSRSLIVKNLVHGKETWFRVSGGNTHGWGKPSEMISFLPR